MTDSQKENEIEMNEPIIDRSSNLHIANDSSLNIKKSEVREENRNSSDVQKLSIKEKQSSADSNPFSTVDDREADQDYQLMI